MADHDVLLWAARSAIGHDAGCDVPLPAPADWPNVLRLAEWHRFAGVLSTELERQGVRGSTPADVQGPLRLALTRNAVRNLRFRAELGTLLDILHAAGTSAMLLKGAALVFADLEYGYADLDVRPMTDIDLLFEAEQVDAALNALRRNGYAPPAGIDGRPHDVVPHDHHHRPPLASPDHAVIVEVHDHIVPPQWRSFTTHEMWSRARSARAAGRACLVPAADDMLMHLCLHFAYDRAHQAPAALMQATDIARIMSMGREVHWARFEASVREHGLCGPVAFALLSATTLLHAQCGIDLRRLTPSALDERVLADLLQHRVLMAQTSSVLHVRKYFTRRGLKARLLPPAAKVRSRYAPEPTTRGALRAYGRHAAYAVGVGTRPFRQPSRFLAERRAARNLDALCRL